MPAVIETWSEKYMLGVEEIDAQHKRFFDATQELYFKILNSAGEEAVQESLGFLKKYAIEHFATEEAMMEKHGYPGLAEHKKEHAAFIERLEGLADEFDVFKAPTQEMADKILQLSQDWLLEHIADEDTHYAPYVKKET